MRVYFSFLLMALVIVCAVISGALAQFRLETASAFKRDEVRLDCGVISFPSSVLGTSSGDRLLMQCNIEEIRHD